LEAIQSKIVRQNILPGVLDVPESTLGSGEQWWLRWFCRSVTGLDPNREKLDYFLK